MKISSENSPDRDADAVRRAEGSTREPEYSEGITEIAGVPSSGHASKGILQEPKRAPHLLHTERNASHQEVREPKGDRRDTDGCRAVLRTHSTDESGKPQGSRKERPRYPLEGRGKQADVPAEGNIDRTQNLNLYATKLDRIAELAREDPKRQFFSIAHLITPEALGAAFRSLRKAASAGVDGVTYEVYEANAERNIQQLYQRLKDGRYQTQPLRRIYIPKEDGKQRPISIPALEDKIVQKVAVEILNAIYEQDFLDCSYGFRPGRSPHQALDKLRADICTRPTEWILEIDIKAYFDSIVREQLMEMVGKRISDGSMLRLIRKWIQVGYIDDGSLLVSETGTGQGQTISPLLANVYLHHVLDEWFEQVVKPRLRGEAHEIRFADDAVICFQYREDAEKVMDVLSRRFAKYGLTLHPEKTRLLEFGRCAMGKAKRQGRKPGTFDFLGLTHICAPSRKGGFTVHVRTMRKRLRRSLNEIAQWCQEHRHEPVDQQQKTLNAKLRGHNQYYGRPTNYRGILRFYRGVRHIWRRWLSRRTRGRPLTWEKYNALLQRHPLLPPRIMHTWVQQ